jgi:hypothetical protein
MQALLIAISVSAATAFNFGGFNIPLPSLPTGFLPSLPPLPSAIVDLPASFFDEIRPQITTIPDFSIPPITESLFPIGSRLSIPSLPPLPSGDLLPASLPAFPSFKPFPSDVADAISSRLGEINGALASAGFSRLPTVPADPLAAAASLRGALASLRSDLEDGRDGLDSLINSYMNVTQRNFTIPASEEELKGILENRGGFDMGRADAILEDLGSKTGQDIRGSIRMISALIFKNESSLMGDAEQTFSRVTQEFTYHASRIREGAEQVFNFSQTQIQLPQMLSLNLENKTLSVIQYASNPYQFLSGQQVNSQVVSIMIADLAGNETQVRDLVDAIRFTLPLNVTEAEYNELLGSGKAACVYWDDASSAWQTDGCSLIELLPEAARCACTHLTDFAVAAVAASATVMPVAMPPSPSMAILEASLTASATTATTAATAAISATGRPAVILAVRSSEAASSGVPATTIVGAALGSFVAIGGIALIVANIIHHNRKEKAKMALKSIRTVSPISSKPTGWV